MKYDPDQVQVIFAGQRLDLASGDYIIFDEVDPTPITPGALARLRAYMRERDPMLSPEQCAEILARVNAAGGRRAVGQVRSF